MSQVGYLEHPCDRSRDPEIPDRDRRHYGRRVLKTTTGGTCDMRHPEMNEAKYISSEAADEPQ